MLQIDPEERLNVIHVPGKNGIVYPAGTHGAARHQEAVFHGVVDITGKAVTKGGIADVVELVLLPAVGDDRNGRLRAEQAGGKQHRVGASGDVQHTVRIERENLPEHLQHFLRVIHAGAVEDELHMQPAVPEIETELVLQVEIGGDASGTDVDNPFRLKHVHAENVFQWPFVIEFDQSFHHCAPFLWQGIWILYPQTGVGARSLKPHPNRKYALRERRNRPAGRIFQVCLYAEGG